MQRSWLVLALVACGPPVNATLADLPELRVQLQTNREVDNNDDDRSPRWVMAWLYYDAEAFMATHGGACATLDVSGTFNGADLDLANPGQNDEDGTTCMTPYLDTKMVLGADEPGHLVLDDGGHTIEATYAPGVLTRVARLESHPSWSFRAGERVIVSWSHPADLVGRAASDIEVRVGYADGQDVAINGNEIHFTVPKLPPNDAKVVDIILRPFSEPGEAQSCTGAPRCGYDALLGYEHTVHLEE